jgi:Putative peptidoglycan binding domain
MKTKFCLLVLTVGAALAASVHADGRHGDGNSAVASRAPARASASSVHSMPRGNFVGGRAMMQGQRFSSIGMRSTPPAFRQHYVNPNRGALINQQFTSRPLNRTEGLTRFSSPETRTATFENRRADGPRQIGNENRGYVNPNGETSLSQRFASRTLNRTEGLTRFSNPETHPARSETRRDDRMGQIGNGNRGLNAGREHVFARRSAGWHPDWDRHSEHWWNGHCCRFINGSWFIFDLGFYPWWPYGYGYPYYGYYPYNYYPSDYYYPSGDYSYGYGPGAYDNGGGGYYGSGTYDSSDQYTDRTIADVQTQLAKEGYYRGEIDGVLGPETRRAIVSFQSDHGLRVTGNLTQETLSTLGL